MATVGVKGLTHTCSEKYCKYGQHLRNVLTFNLLNQEIKLAADSNSKKITNLRKKLILILDRVQRISPLGIIVDARRTLDEIDDHYGHYQSEPAMP